MDADVKARVLCVDDDERNLRLLGALLVSEGYETDFCKSGKEALEKMRTAIPDIVLLDIIMPEMSGIAVLEKLRLEERTRLIPVILVTALTDEEDRIRGIKAGCDDFISKPFDRAELLARIQSLLKMSFYRRALDEREKFCTVIGEMLDGVIVFSPDWRLMNINGAAKKYLNMGGSENFLDHIFGNFSISISREALMDPAVAHKSFGIMRPESEVSLPAYLQADVDLLKNSIGELSSIVWVLRDVTEAKKEEIAKQSFLKFISHKLRLPLTVMLEGISVLKDEVPGVLNEKQNEILDAVAKKTAQLNMMIERLIKFTAVMREDLCREKEVVNLSAYIPVLLGPLIETAKNKQVDIRLVCENNQCVVVLCRDYFDLIMECLVENAIKFDDHSLVVIEIAMRPLPAGGFEFRVRDHGRGIAGEQQKKIFEKFYQAEKYFTGQAEGIGLGLPLVKHLVECLGGAITVASEVGRGSTFTFTIT